MPIIRGNDIPGTVMDRLIRNPHMLPSVPTSLNLQEEIFQFKRGERVRRASEAAYATRRRKIDEERVERLRRHSVSPAQLNRTVMLTDIDNSFDYDEDESLELPFLNSETPSQRERRNSSIIRSSNYYSYARPRSSSLTETMKSLTAKNVHSHRNKGSQSLNRSKSSLGFTRTPSASSTPSTPLKQIIKIPQTPNTSARKLKLSGINKSVINKLKERCLSVGRPSPAFRNRDFHHDRQGNEWKMQPCWHRIMREEYKKMGIDELWRGERERFFREFRRDRVFKDQTKRRASMHL